MRCPRPDVLLACIKGAAATAATPAHTQTLFMMPVGVPRSPGCVWLFLHPSRPMESLVMCKKNSSAGPSQYVDLASVQLGQSCHFNQSKVFCFGLSSSSCLQFSGDFQFSVYGNEHQAPNGLRPDLKPSSSTRHLVCTPLQQLDPSTQTLLSSSSTVQPLSWPPSP